MDKFLKLLSKIFWGKKIFSIVFSILLFKNNLKQKVISKVWNIGKRRYIDT